MLYEQLKRMKKLAGIREGSETGLAAGAMIVAKDTGKVLIALRSERCEEPHTWCGVGGGVEKGEDIKTGLKRELGEEIGFTGKIKLVPAYQSKKKNFTFHNFFGFVDKEFKPKLNDEHTEAKWVTLDQLKNIPDLHYGIKEFMKEKSDDFEKYLGDKEALSESRFEGGTRTYWGNVAAGVVPICTTTGRALIGLRSDSVMEPHTWGGFGGKLDEGEDSPHEAAEREMQEELEHHGSVQLVAGYVFTDGGFSYHNFLGLVEEEFEPTLNWENDDARWMTYEELLRLPKKHFGLVAFLKNSKSLFERYMQG